MNGAFRPGPTLTNPYQQQMGQNPFPMPNVGQPQAPAPQMPQPQMMAPPMVGQPMPAATQAQPPMQRPEPSGTWPSPPPNLRGAFRAGR